MFSRSRDFFFKNEYRFCTNQNDSYERTTSQNNTYNRTTLAWHKWQRDPQKILNNVPFSNLFYCKSCSIAASGICQTCFLDNKKLCYKQVGSTCCWLQTGFVRNKTSRPENRSRQRVWLFSTHLVNLWHKSIAFSKGKRAALVGSVNESKHGAKQVQSKRVNLNRHLYLQLQNNHNHNATSCLSAINYLTKQPYKATFLPVFPGNKTAFVVGSRHVKEQAFGCLARKQCLFLSESKMSMKTKTKEFFRP